MTSWCTSPRSLSQRRISLRNAADNGDSAHNIPGPLATMSFRVSGSRNMVSDLPSSHSTLLPTSNKSNHHLPPSLLPSAPTSPPTPAPSPAPHRRTSSWQSGEEETEESLLLNAKTRFDTLTCTQKQKFLVDLLNLCDNQLLSFVSSFVSPLLRKDPFQTLPNELCLRVLSFIDEPKTLSRASQVSRRWYELLSDDITWKNLCEKHAYACRQLSDDDDHDFVDPFHGHRSSSIFDSLPSRTGVRKWDILASHRPDSISNISAALSLDSPWPTTPTRKRRVQPSSYRTHFKQKYMVESAWNKGGRCARKHINPDQGVVTSLHLTPKYIVVALDNAKIHVYDTNGENQRTLQGHVMGVWTMVPWNDILVSGGCDREVRVWNMATGACIHLLRGHTSTVRCLKMSNENTAISGSRDTTLRIWDLATGMCRSVLVGHQASVRCLGIHGDLVVSGSYDTTARIWSISEGRCMRTLSGHFSQIYAIAFDGKRIATGSLDTSVRIWDPHTGQCHAILQGHTSLVGQLQMRGDTLVTGGSDGSVRVWSLTQMAPIHRLAAHDNSVTSLQFDSTRIVSGGSDGRVKVWSLKTGQQLRELSTPAEAVWRVAFEEEKAVIMANRSGRTIMEVWSFSPLLEEPSDDNVVESVLTTPALRPSSENSSRISVHNYRRRVAPSNPPPAISLADGGDYPMPDAPPS